MDVDLGNGRGAGDAGVGDCKVGRRAKGEGSYSIEGGG